MKSQKLLFFADEPDHIYTDILKQYSKDQYICYNSYKDFMFHKKITQHIKIIIVRKLTTRYQVFRMKNIAKHYPNILFIITKEKTENIF